MIKNNKTKYTFIRCLRMPFYIWNDFDHAFVYALNCAFELLSSITDLLVGLAEFIFVLQVIICKHQSLPNGSQSQNTNISLQLALFFIIFDRKHMTTWNSYDVSCGFQGLFTSLAVIDSSNIFVNKRTHLV